MVTNWPGVLWLKDPSPPSDSDVGATFAAGVLGMQMQSLVSESRFYSV